MESEVRKLRACLLCSLVKTFEAFKTEGCDNCEDYLRLRGNPDRIHECTTTNYSGYYKRVNKMLLICRLVGIAQKKQSWVISWMRMQNRQPGTYALSLQDSLPEDILDDIQKS